MAKVYISLGTNLGNKEQNLRNAIGEITQTCGKVEQTSPIYSSAPWGFESFNNFLNQVVLIETKFSPQQLIKCLLEIEKSMGRNRSTVDYQDRIIDLDILFYDDLIIEEDSLIIPHPSLHNRNFIMQPFLEMCPSFVHPKLKKTISEILNSSTDTIKAYKQ